MKKIFLINLLIAFFFLFSSQNSNAQTTNAIETISFKVAGVCGMCKDRIENAALIKGVKETKWDKTTGVLKLLINTKKANLEDIHTSIAKAGHDTSLKKGNDKAYAKLPPCCKYRDKNITAH